MNMGMGGLFFAETIAGAGSYKYVKRNRKLSKDKIIAVRKLQRVQEVESVSVVDKYKGRNVDMIA